MAMDAKRGDEADHAAGRIGRSMQADQRLRQSLILHSSFEIVNLTKRPVNITAMHGSYSFPPDRNKGAVKVIGNP